MSERNLTTFPRSKRLHSRADYQKIYNAGTREKSSTLVAAYRLCDTSRLGITISRKWGKAHDRNRFKRMIREAYRALPTELTLGIELNIHPRSGYQNLTTKSVIEELRLIIRRIRDKAQS